MVMNNPRTRLLKLVMQLRLIWHFFDLKRIHVDTLWHNQISYILQHSKNKIIIYPEILNYTNINLLKCSPSFIAKAPSNPNVTCFTFITFYLVPVAYTYRSKKYIEK